MRRLVFVASFLTLGSCGGPPSKINPGPATVPTPDGGVVLAPCSPSPSVFAAGARLGTADDRFLYAFSGRQVVRIPLGGGPPETVVDGIDMDQADELVADDQFLYWRAIDGTNAIMRAPKSGGAPIVVARGALTGLAVAGGFLYYQSRFVIYDIDRDGSGAATAIVPQSSATFTLDNDFVWYRDFDTGVLRSAPLQDGHAGVLDTGAQDLAVDSEFAYLTTNNGPIARVDKATGATTPIFGGYAHNGAGAWIGTLRADGTNVYAIIGTPRQLWRIARDGSSATLLASTEVAAPFLLVADSVFYLRPNGAAGDVMRVCK